MNNHAINCPCCNTTLDRVTAEQIIRFGTRWACPVCGHVMDYAEQQMSKPGISLEAKQFWGVVGAGAFVVGLIKLLDRLDVWA